MFKKPFLNKNWSLTSEQALLSCYSRPVAGGGRSSRQFHHFPVTALDTASHKILQAAGQSISGWERVFLLAGITASSSRYWQIFTDFPLLKSFNHKNLFHNKELWGDYCGQLILSHTAEKNDGGRREGALLASTGMLISCSLASLCPGRCPWSPWGSALPRPGKGQSVPIAH